MTIERFQNPVTNSAIKLRLTTFNSNNFKNVESIEKVEIYFVECTAPSCGEKSENAKKLTLIETIDGVDIASEDVGMYSIEISTTEPKYLIGKYVDRWYVVFEDGEATAKVDNDFEIYSDTWITSTLPAVYSFDFKFQPNRIRKGSKKWLIIQILPNVPRSTDLERYYYNLAVSAELRVSIEQTCGPCVPEEADLRVIVDNDQVEIRERCFGFYKIDTTDWDCGIYNIWFQLTYADTVDVSPIFQFQIY